MSNIREEYLHRRKELLEFLLQQKRNQVKKKYAKFPYTKLTNGEKIWWKTPYYEFSIMTSPGNGSGLSWMFETRLSYRFKEFPSDHWLEKWIPVI